MKLIGMMALANSLNGTFIDTELRGVEVLQAGEVSDQGWLESGFAIKSDAFTYSEIRFGNDNRLYIEHFDIHDTPITIGGSDMD